MVYLLLGTGFEETEAIAPLDLLRRAGVAVKTVGINGKTVYGGHGIGVEADITIEEWDPSDLQWAYENDKFVAAICAGPTVLADLGITDGKNATCYPGCEDQMGNANMVPEVAFVRDGRVITGTSAGCAIPFGLALIAALKGHEAADAIFEQIVIR